MKLVWSAFALADRDDIFTYLEARNPSAAVRIDELIDTTLRQIARFPESGRSGRMVGTRELVIPRTPYIAVYTVSPERIRILRLLHGAQRWPDEDAPR
jgi:addiction module RelE/StbE family toxin